MITKKDYIASLLRCSKTYGKTYEELSSVFPEIESDNFIKSDDQETESWFDNEDKKFDWQVNIENSKIEHPYKLKEYELVREQFLKFIRKNYSKHKIYNLDDFKDFIDLKTLNKLNNGLYFNTFIIHNDVISRPTIILKNDNGIEIINFFSSTSPKRIHNFKMLFDYQVCMAANVLIKNISYYLINKSGHEKNTLLFKKFIILLKTKVLANKKYNEFSNLNSKELINSIESPIVKTFKSGKLLSKSNIIYDSEKFWHDINYLKNYIPSLDNNYEYVPEICHGVYGKCPYFNQCSKKILSKKWKSLNYSGNVFSGNSDDKNEEKSDIKFNINDVGLRDYFKYLKDDNPYDILINRNVTLNELSRYNRNIIWFDFETISTPFSVFNKWPEPFWQLPFQCSIIQTNNTNIINKPINLVYDPANICYENMVEIINKLYHKDHIYVVYNKTFEITVLNKIRKLIKTKILLKKIDHIINNIVDLANFFSVGKTTWCLKIKELNGFYSIKKINAYMNKYSSWIYNKNEISDYKNLENITNGLEATSIGKGRFYGLIKDKIWKDYTADLKAYCELDVKMMIYCLIFVKSLLLEDRKNSSIKIKWVN